MDGAFGLFGFGPEGWGGPMVQAAGMTLLVSAGGYLLGGVIGALGAWAKLRGGPALRTVADAYTTVLRGIPDLLVIYLFYFGTGMALGAVAGLFGHSGFVAFPGAVAGILAIGVVAGAYHTEVLRGGVGAVGRGEIEAGLALGLHPWTLFHRVVAPLALRSALPGLGNVWQLVLKEAALVSVTGTVELVRQAQLGSGATRSPFAFYLAAGVLYLVITVSTGLLFQVAEAHVGRGTSRAAGSMGRRA